MKRTFTLFFIALCALCAYATPITIKPGLIYEQSNNKYTIEFNMPDYVIGTDTITIPDPNNPHNQIDVVFSRLIISGDDYFDYLSEDGRPELPFYSMSFILPYNNTYFDVTDVQILDSINIVLQEDYYPAQMQDNFSDGYSFDNEYYNSFNNTWHWNYDTISAIEYRHSKGLIYSIFPCHYEPYSHTLTVITKATYEITYDGTFISSPSGILDWNYYNFYSNLPDYPNSVPSIEGTKYLIISANEWADDPALLDFQDHKESLGYDVTLTPLNEVGDNTPAAIRTYIQTMYNDHQADYVLLVGDVDLLPFSAGVENDSTNPPTDVYYECLSRSTISDQKHDLSPSVFLGRWPVQASFELRNIVDKTIASDLHLGEGLQSYTPCEIGIFSGSGDREKYVYNTCKYIYKHTILQHSNYYTGDLIDGRTLTPSTAYAFMESYLEGYNDIPTWMFIYHGHGNSDHIGPPYYISYSYLYNITTSTLEFQPFCFGFACKLGNIYSNNNFARAWLTNTEGGVSFLGATTASFPTPDRYFSRKLFNQLGNRPIMTIGEFVGNARANYYNPDQVEWRFREAKKYVLYGDPSLYLFGLDITYHTPFFVKQRDNQIEQKEGNIEIKDYTLFVNGVSDNIISVNIYSITGQLLLTSHTNQIDLQGLPAGLYTAVIQTENNQFSKKVILK